MLTLRKRGRYWYARGTVPVRAHGGKISRCRIEESTREESKARASRVAADIAQHYHEQAYRPKAKSISFTEAALTYVETKNPSKRDRQFAAKLVAHFGEMPIDQIDQAAIANAAVTLYPTGSASTHNRAVYAPAVTIMRLSQARPDFRRPRSRSKKPQIPPEGWFDQVLPHCPDRLAGLLIFLTLTGRRISDALVAIDNGDGTVTIGRTKTGGAVTVVVPNLCRDLLPDLGRSPGLRVWSFGDRHNVYRALRAVCKRAGLPYYGTHALGRHAFATRLLREGKSLKFVADAGGWASIKMPAQHYAHLEKSEVQDEVAKLGKEWGKRFKKKRKNG